MYKCLKRRYYWENMCRDCHLIHKYCDACQQFKAVAPRQGRVGHTQYILDSGTVGHTIIIDQAGPYGNKTAATLRGNRTALVVQDEFSRFCVPFPTNSVTSEFVIDSSNTLRTRSKGYKSRPLTNGKAVRQK